MSDSSKNSSENAIQSGAAPRHNPPRDHGDVPRRRDDESDSSAAIFWIMLTAGVLTLLCLVCGVGGTGVLFVFRLGAREEAVAQRQAHLAAERAAMIEEKIAEEKMLAQKDVDVIPIVEPMEQPPAAPPANADERIRNGDFEQGNVGFRSDYKRAPGNIRPEITYDVVVDPRNCHGEAASFRDHTSGKGNMMVVNGAVAPGLVVWGQTVDVRPGADYTFSLWVASWLPFSPADLDIRINGKSIGRVVAPTTVGQWREFRVVWNAGADSTAAIAIYDLNTAVSGNDFALDDISMRGPPPAAK